jgi:hypothetical protein
MAIDISAIRNKLQSLQSKTNKQENLWKPAPGTHQVRIVPYIHNRENPFLEMYFHYNFSGKNILSPVSFGKQDPIVEFADKLKSTGNKEDWKMGKGLEPKMRCYVPILIRGKESEGIKFWGFGKTVYQELLGFIADADYGDITDPMSGRDITVEFKSKEATGKDYPETSIRVKPNTSPMTESKEVLELIKNQPKITELFKEYSYDEIEKLLQEWMNPTEPANTEDATDSSKSSNKKSLETESATTNKVEDVSAAFDALFSKK